MTSILRLKRWSRLAMPAAIVLSALFLGTTGIRAAGLLKPIGGGDESSVFIKSHKVEVMINNGFSRTEVDQVFYNDTDSDLQAIYSFPMPKQASLSELSLWIDGSEVIGEVVERERARRIYQEQAAQGNDTAIAEKNDFKTFDIGVGLVRARSEARVRIVYYQPLEIDLNVGRYLYPLAEGGVDEERIEFWSVDDRVDGSFSFKLTLKSSFPVSDVRVPGFDQEAVINKVSSGMESAAGGDVYEVVLDKPEGANLSRDIIFYYKLDDTAPARVELIPYRANPKEPGTFMVVVTPAADLQRISEGVDWLFVLDVSGSMSGGKISTLAGGVGRILGKMSPQDRFRIITFNNSARDLTGGFVSATPENVHRWIGGVKQIRADGGTNLYSGLDMAYGSLEEDRTTAIILATDGVCNVGRTEHSDFIKLLAQHDVRLFTFVIGNSANQPLMDRLALESGGFTMNISDGDDLSGRLIQAKAKVLHECMHDVKFRFKGERVRDLTPQRFGNLYLGQQAVLFGRYTGSGEVVLEMTARISGQEQSWTCKTFLPEVDTANPELERLWALSSIEENMQEIRNFGEKEKLRLIQL